MIRNERLVVCNELLYKAFAENPFGNVMVFVETDDREYEISDVKVEQSIDCNDKIQTVVKVKVE